MPTFDVDYRGDTEIDITPRAFYNTCTKREIEELKRLLSEDNTTRSNLPGESTIDEKEYYDTVDKLSKSYYKLDNLEIKMLKLIAEKL